jgi:hypothetical protein
MFDHNYGTEETVLGLNIKLEVISVCEVDALPESKTARKQILTFDIV